MIGRIYSLNRIYLGVPVECKYAAEIEGERQYFVNKEDALLYLYDHDISVFQFLMKEVSKYTNITSIPHYEFWHIKNRIGYVVHDNEYYNTVDNITKKQRAYVWRFVGYGRSLYASTKDELKEKVIEQIHQYSEDVNQRGYNIYPFYTRYNRGEIPKPKPKPKLTTEDKMDFIAIDFEIANNNMNSACSMGMIFVKDNQIIEEKYYLIHPPTMEFDKDMILVHGIKPIDVLSAPSFNGIWEQIKHHFSQTIIVAHNAQFDMSVLYACLKEYSLEIPEFNYLCSIPISTKATRGVKVGNSLKERCLHFDIEFEDHHNALADARACAQLVIKSVESKKANSIFSFINRHSSLPIKKFSELKPQTHLFKKKTYNNINISEIAATVESFNEDHPFYEKNIVFTGTLHTIDRKPPCSMSST